MDKEMSYKQLGSLLLTAATGENRLEMIISAVIAVFAYIATQFFGGWDTALKVLFYLMIADYISGVLGAVKTKSMSSEVMFWGGVRKAVVLGVIALSVLLDQLVGGETPVFRTLALYYYAGREGLSLIENLDVLGVQLPPPLKKFLKQLNDKGNGKD
jgi:toxin secretion/phage lysis holin